jgi:putative redox protein
MSTDTLPLTAELLWAEGLRFDATSGKTTVVVDGDSSVGPSPVQLLVIGLAGCMAMDVLEIVRRGRHDVTGFRARLSGTRAAVPPRRFTAIQLRFDVYGDVPANAVERAVALSRDKYCSVWHSLRQDIEFSTEFEIHS